MIYSLIPPRTIRGKILLFDLSYNLFTCHLPGFIRVPSYEVRVTGNTQIMCPLEGARDLVCIDAQLSNPQPSSQRVVDGRSATVVLSVTALSSFIDCGNVHCYLDGLEQGLARLTLPNRVECDISYPFDTQSLGFNSKLDLRSQVGESLPWTANSVTFSWLGDCGTASPACNAPNGGTCDAAAGCVCNNGYKGKSELFILILI